jgi:leucyl aminopeptidase
MDFELKTLSRARVAAEKCDALVVLVPEQSPTEADLISALIGHALKQGDFEAKPGRLLQAYRTPGLATSRLVLVGAGDGSAKQVRSAVTAALGALKGSNVRRVIVSLGWLSGDLSGPTSAAVLGFGRCGVQLPVHQVQARAVQAAVCAGGRARRAGGAREL